MNTQEIVKYFHNEMNKKELNIILLKREDVINWLFNIHTYKEENKKKENKKKENTYNKTEEDKWGQNMIKLFCSSKTKNQWSTPFSERIVKEIYEVVYNQKQINKPEKKDNKIVDYESNDYVIESKTGTYYTSGSAHEKGYGVMIKYASIPSLYKKPLHIIFSGRAEIEAKKFGLIGKQDCPHKQEFLDVAIKKQIYHFGVSDIIREYVNKLKEEKNLLSIDNIKSTC